jgi:5-formyltetrahydrofolate cyclo-ligase
MTDVTAEAQHRKQEIRAEARARRRRQSDSDRLSRIILGRLAALPEYARAETVMLYLSFRSEVHTHDFPATLWKDGKRAVVPYCVADSLELFKLEDAEELCPGAHGILEPKAELRGWPDRCVAPAELDLIVLPGLAFDPHCGRVGYGRGYYDRLLRHVRPETALVGVGFQCQIFPEVPVLPYDVRVHKVVTEETVYPNGLSAKSTFR